LHQEARGSSIDRDLTEGGVKDYSVHSNAINKATEAQSKVVSAVVHIDNQALQLYSNFLLEKVGQPWSKILVEQINCSPWKDLRGKLVFCNDAAKAQWCYISNGL
jgi:ABC-type xylose transport system substrate-binding protein